ncbi:MAG: methyltransferase domain-containing protein, partial [Clostridia bacterium]|nr:methyltransferase domain-containing protein [Clostridia bacterium]
MRRKSRLDERVAACGKYLLKTESEDFYAKPTENRYDFIDLNKVFGNSAPVMLEIGCGKGGFAFKHAERYPDVNLIAVEKISNVIIEACEKADAEKPANLRFMNVGAENLLYYLKPGTVSRIYLNFSCPYPKYTYRNRRLTYYRYLEIYKKLLTID